MINLENKKIGLALSGGGYRAAFFHLGVISYLAEKNLLEKVTHISTVSGGSILMGLIYSLNNYKWPSSKIYLKYILPSAKQKLLETALLEESPILTSLISIFTNGKYTSHSDVSKRLKTYLNMDIDIQDLPSHPIWTINTTTGETGKLCKIEKSKLSDYTLGHIRNPHINLADAIAASAGFPIAIGPFVLDLSKHNFIFKKNINQTEISLYDGGLYDNLGSEVLFKNSFSQLSPTIDFAIISDASKPFTPQNNIANTNRFKKFSHIMDISTEQIRSLRLRLIHNLFRRFNYMNGMHIELGDYYLNLHKESNNAKQVNTDLKPLSLETCDDLIANGYASTFKKFDKLLSETTI